MNLEIHPLQGLLHVLLMTTGHGDVIGAYPNVILQPTDVRRRNKPRLEQAMSVQGRLPLTVAHVGLSPRQVLDILAVAHHPLEAGLFEHLIGT